MPKHQIYSLLRLAGVVMCLLAACRVAAIADDTGGVLSTPSPTDLALMAYNLAGVEPPFASLAEADNAVKSLNEFKRPQASKALEEQLRARFQQLKSVKQVRLNVLAEFGEYNTRYGEFDFDVNDGTVIDYQHALRHTLTVHLTNGGLAQSWSIPQADAEKVVSLTGNDRHVSLGMRLELVSATVPLSDYEPIAINARVVDYDIVGLQKKLKLGHVVVK